MPERFNPWTDQAIMPMADSTHSHGNPTLALTNLTGTTASASNGLTLSLSAAAPAGGGFAVQGSGAYTQNTGTIQFANSNGITFGLDTNQMTASVNSTSNVGLNTAATQVTWTVNSGGISLNAGGYLTTAMASNAGSNFAGLGETIGTTAGTDLKMTVDSAGVNISHPKWITTGALSDHSHGNPTLNLTNLTGTTASASNGLTLSLSAAAQGAGSATALNLTNLTGTLSANTGGVSLSLSAAAPGAGGGFAAKGSGTYTQNTGTIAWANSNGITFGLDTNQMTASVNSTSNVGLGTALTAGPLAWTVNSGGISLNAGSAAGTSSGFAGANISMSMTHNTAGLNISASVAAPGGGAAPTLDLFANFDLGVGSAQQFAFSNLAARTNSVIIQPLMGNYDCFPGNITANTMFLKCSMSASTATMSSAHTVSVFVGVYTANNSTLNLLNSVSTSWGSGAGNANLSTVFAGVRWLSIHSSAWSSQPVFTPAHYYWGLMLRTAGQSYNVSAAFAGNTIWGSASATASGTIGVATQASNQTAGMGPWYGVYTAATAALPAVISSNHLNKITDVAIFNPLIMMIRTGPQSF